MINKYIKIWEASNNFCWWDRRFSGSVLLGFLSQTIKKMFYSLYSQLFIIHFSYHFFNSHLKTSKASLLYSYLEPSVQFSRSVVSDSLWPHEPQHASPPCSSPTPGVHPNPCPLSQWCHPTISSSVVPFSSCPQPFPASGSFQWVNPSREVAKVLEFQL